MVGWLCCVYVMFIQGINNKVENFCPKWKCPPTQNNVSLCFLYKNKLLPLKRYHTKNILEPKGKYYDKELKKPL